VPIEKMEDQVQQALSQGFSQQGQEASQATHRHHLVEDDEDLRGEVEGEQ
jgi:hypothetical protein